MAGESELPTVPIPLPSPFFTWIWCNTVKQRFSRFQPYFKENYTVRKCNIGNLTVILRGIIRSKMDFEDFNRIGRGKLRH